MDEVRKKVLLFDLKQDCTVGLIDNKHVLFKLKCEEDFVRLWMKEQWYLGKYPTRTFKWSPLWKIKEETSVVPTWINFLNLDIHLFSKSSLFSIALLNGKPPKMDSSMVSHTRRSLERVCIELDMIQDMPRRVSIGVGETHFWQVVINENLPEYCMHCLKKGHKEKSYIFLKRSKDEVKEGIKETNKLNKPITKTLEILTNQKKPTQTLDFETQIQENPSTTDYSLLKSINNPIHKHHSPFKNKSHNPTHVDLDFNLPNKSPQSNPCPKNPFLITHDQTSKPQFKFLDPKTSTLISNHIQKI